MHRIHHSDEFSEQNSNFGVVFPWWDRLFGTYRDQPAEGHENMGVGLPGVTGEQAVSLFGMLFSPVRTVEHDVTS
jgi:sterol desaturase/sphingolipid hydroxylase (fatty acid hydroxylase superfamily)